MSTKSSGRHHTEIETLMREEIYWYRQLYDLALDRSRAIEESEYLRLAAVSHEMERIQQKIINVGRKLETARLERLEEMRTVDGDEGDRLDILTDEARKLMQEIFFLEKKSLTDLGEKYSYIKKDLIGISERGKFVSYSIKGSSTARLIHTST